jgi:hypothetical protein
MLETFLLGDRAAGAEAAVLDLYAATLPGPCKTERNLFFTFNKARAHPAEAELNSFRPVHHGTIS